MLAGVTWSMEAEEFSALFGMGSSNGNAALPDGRRARVTRGLVAAFVPGPISNRSLFTSGGWEGIPGGTGLGSSMSMGEKI